MRKLAIVHFNPIEQYPPVLNWLGFLASTTAEKEEEVRVFTLRRGKSTAFVPASGRIRIFRMANAGKRGISALVEYGRFFLLTLFQLIRWRPDTLLYYETLSILPVYSYVRFFHPRVRLFIHFHEYTSPDEYRRAGFVVRLAHRLEKKILSRAEWISHTNDQRIALFRKDMEDIRLPDMISLPNFPPAGWAQNAKTKRANAGKTGEPLKLVYVGALSLDTMYTRELAKWVLSQKGRVTWDIYSDNITAEAMAWLQSLDGRLVRFRKAIDYYSLPEVLPDYDLGVILYNGHIPNYVFNAPNKLFEYLVCGLDVWFPHTMKGSHPLVTDGTRPRVAAVDFHHLGDLSVDEWAGHAGLRHVPQDFCCEQVLEPLYAKMRSRS